MTLGLLVQLRGAERRRVKRIVLLPVSTLALALLIPAFAGVRINNSPSLPIGLYVVTSDPSADLVEFCPSEPFAALAFERGYRDKGNCADGGAPLMKPIVARQGDVVEFLSQGVSVNGLMLANSSPLAFDTSGRTLQHWPYGRYSVKDGTAWVISSYNRRSFDSRYFGPITLAQIRHRLHPLLTQ